MWGFIFFVNNPTFFHHHSFQSSCRQFDIVLLVDGIRTLAIVVIVEPIQTNLVSSMALSRGVAITLAALLKEGFYCDCYLVDVFLLLAVEILTCLHQQVDNFFH